MEGETEEQGESAESTQVDAPTHTSGQESGEPVAQHGVDNNACDGAVDPVQGTLIPTDTQDDSDGLTMASLPAQAAVNPASVSPHPSNIHNRPSEPCWYCLRSLNSDYRPETAKQAEADPTSALPSSGQKVSYQTDPRPHFGVAWSSRSTCRPLWGSEGPCWGQRNQEVPNQTHTCPHCHLGLSPDTLRWHEAKCLLFEGLRNSHK